MKVRSRAALTALLAGLGMLALAPAPAHASKEGRRNTALVLGGVAVYGALKKQPVIAGAAGAGAVYSWVRSNKADDDRHRYRRGRYDRDYRYDRDHRYDRDYRYDRRDRYDDYRYRRSDYEYGRGGYRRGDDDCDDRGRGYRRDRYYR
jgi:hypothetical protein